MKGERKLASLYISPAALREQANAMESLRQQQQDVMRRMRILIMGLDEDWKGEAQAALVTKFLSKQKTITDFSDALESYITLARSAADSAEKIDQELLKKIRGI